MEVCQWYSVQCLSECTLLEKSVDICFHHRLRALPEGPPLCDFLSWEVQRLCSQCKVGLWLWNFKKTFFGYPAPRPRETGFCAIFLWQCIDFFFFLVHPCTKTIALQVLWFFRCDSPFHPGPWLWSLVPRWLFKPRMLYFSFNQDQKVLCVQPQPQHHVPHPHSGFQLPLPFLFFFFL